MISVGETLRRERLKRNLDLDQVSQELKIAPRFLEAIEQERFDQLPGSVFAKSFVRQYARMLGLDEEEMAAEVRRALEPPPSLNAHRAPEAARQTADQIHLPRVEEWAGPGERRFNFSASLPSLAMVVAVMLVCSLVYSWWQRERRGVSAHESATAQQQTAQANPSAAPAETAPATVTPSTGESAAPAASAPSEAPARPAETASAPVAAQGQAPAAAPKAARPAGDPASAATAAARPVNGAAPPATEAGLASRDGEAAAANVHLELTADEPVWVLARSNGKYLFSGTIEPNQTRSVAGTGPVTVRLGNAGGVSITLNGKNIGSVGPRGQVRTVQFTSGGFQIVAAPKPPLPEPLDR